MAATKFNVLLTTYEMANKDAAVLAEIEWEVSGGRGELFVVGCLR
jgi:hypothetical protein